MLGGVKMLCRVLVGRRIAAADVTAFQTQAQMHPRCADSQTFFAPVRLWLDVLDVIEMRARNHSHAPFVVD